MSKQKGLAYFGFNVSEPKRKKTTDELREQQHEYDATRQSRKFRPH